MAGAKEWGPKVEPEEADLEFAGLGLHIRRLDTPGWRSGEEFYAVTVTAPDGSAYPYTASVGIADKFRGMGLLNAALAALTDIREVREDFGLYRSVMRRLFRKRAEADALAVEARKAARSFGLEEVEAAVDAVSLELRKLPVVQRELRRSWEELMRRQRTPE